VTTGFKAKACSTVIGGEGVGRVEGEEELLGFDHESPDKSVYARGTKKRGEGTRNVIEDDERARFRKKDR